MGVAAIVLTVAAAGLTPAVASIRTSSLAVNADAPDPTIIAVGSSYYMYTTGTSGRYVPVWHSTDRVHWTLVGDAMPTPPSYAQRLWTYTWAPTVVATNSGYTMYVTVRTIAPNRLCIAALTSASPAGPFVSHSSRPVACGIDPDTYRDAHGTDWLVWKDTAANAIVSQALSADGMSTVGSPATILRADQTWEHGTVEGPDMTAAPGGGIELFYAAGDWTTSTYTTGHAVCRAPNQPCTKDRTPYLSSDANGAGPGGASVFSDSTGRYLVYHVWRGTPTATTAGSYRAAVISPLPSRAGDAQVVTVRSAGECASTLCPEAMTRVSVVASAGAPVGVASATGGTRSWVVTTAGHVIGLHGTASLGSAASLRLHEAIVGITATPSGHGYWLVAADGGIFTYGDAKFYGSAGAIHLNQPIVAMTTTPTGHGYWLVAADGGIFTYGDAKFYGSAGAIHLDQPIVAMTTTPTGHGYWLVAADGGIFTYGDARFSGSATRVSRSEGVRFIGGFGVSTTIEVVGVT